MRNVQKINKLEMTGITKCFHTLTANQDIDLTVRSGEVLGLLGENGAGKTTLMNILYGLYSADRGTIKIDDREVVLGSPRESIRLGIGMVHQHFMLVQNHTVAENVALGFEEAPFLFPLRLVEKKLAEFSERYGLKVDAHEKIWQLSAGEQQRVEIVKALFQGADLLILDEPTSVLTPAEAEELFTILKAMVAEGHSVIFISHKLKEVLDLCDRVVVLRRGRVVGTTPTEDVDKRALAQMMIGRDILFNLHKDELEPGEQVLEVSGVTVLGDRGNQAVKGVSFQIHRNEIYGIAGVSGNGQRELVEAITGLRRPAGGSIKIGAREISGNSPKVINEMRVSHVPEERIKFGVVPNLFVYENAILKHHRRQAFSRILFLRIDRIKKHAAYLIDSFKIDAPSVKTPLKNLSGGNIQKLILGREITADPSLLVAAHPTYGLDVGATEYIRTLLLERRKQGGAILLVSEDLEELFELSDRLAIMFAGEIMGVVETRNADIGDVGMMMTGVSMSTAAGRK